MPAPAVPRCACGGSCPLCQPLDPALRGSFERALGQPLGEVRTHSGPEASEVARTAGVRAFARGPDIVLGQPAPRSGTFSERFLLAHEIAHVVQQRAAAGVRDVAKPASGRDAGAEQEAHEIALRLALGLGPARARYRPAVGALLASTLSDNVGAIWLSTADKGRVFDVLRAQSPVSDADLDALLLRVFSTGSDDLWLAQTIVRNGPEPLWPVNDFEERRRRQRDHGWAEERGGIRGSIATTAGSRSVDAFFFPGTSDERALVVAGVHGSEQGGIEVAEMLIQTLHNALLRPYYSVIVVPTLFPDNAASRAREGSTPTNRNFPDPGRSLATATPSGSTTPMDTAGRAILPENFALMRLIERFRPSRVASVHGSFDRGAAGVFSDAHTVSGSARARAVAAHPGDPAAAAVAVAALETAAGARTRSDQAMALSMARTMDASGFGRAVLGNRLHGTPTSGWSGSVPGGTSFGAWGPQDITEGRATDRPSMTVLTIEVATNIRSTDLAGVSAANRRAELASYRDVIQNIFLGPP